MDCPKCGYALAPLEKECSRCQRIAHEEFLRSPAAVWPPAIGPAPIMEPPPPIAPAYPPRPAYYEDNSAQNSSGEERGCPLEIAELHWNWGAFWCGWLWCFLNGLPGLAVLVLGVGALFLYFSVTILPAGYALPSELIALLILGMHCHLGLRGHTLAWERRRFFGGLVHYFAVQRAWALGGLITFGITATFLTVSTVLFLNAFRAYEARRQQHPPAVTQASPRGLAPVILRAAPPAQPIFRQGLRSPMEPYRWTPSGPRRPQYAPEHGPDDIPVPGQGAPPVDAGKASGSMPSVPVSNPAASSSPVPTLDPRAGPSTDDSSAPVGSPGIDPSSGQPSTSLAPTPDSAPEPPAANGTSAPP